MIKRRALPPCFSIGRQHRNRLSLLCRYYLVAVLTIKKTLFKYLFSKMFMCQILELRVANAVNQMCTQDFTENEHLHLYV